MNIVQKILRGCDMARFTIECEKGHYDNGFFDKMVIYYRFITDSIKMN